MLPASEYSLARWKKTSTSWSSSRIATLISWRFAAITNSLLMHAPTVHGENRSSKKARDNTVSPCPGDPLDRLPGAHGLENLSASQDGDRSQHPAGAQPNRWSGLKSGRG